MGELNRTGKVGEALWTLREGMRWVMGRRALYRVRGGSMMPTLADGDYVLVDPRARELPHAGDIVVAREPHADRVLVKRVRSTGTSTFALGSDDPNEGRDSRHFGSVPLDHLLGIVTLAYKRP